MTFFIIAFFISAVIFLILTARVRPAYTSALAFLIFLVSFFPFIWGVAISFFNFFPPTMNFAGLKNFSVVIADPGLALSVKITAIWALLVVILQLIVSYTLALTLLSLKRFSKIFYMIILIPWAIPTYISVISWTALVEGYGGDSILSRLLGMNFDLSSNIPAAFLWTAFIGAWLGVPLMTLVIVSAMQTVTPQLKALAKLDGMDPIENALNLYIPYTFPVVFPYIFITFLRSFKEFTTIFLMTNGGPAITSGFGTRSIVGATTLLGVFVYNKFTSLRNYGLIGAYSAVVGLIMIALVLIGWNYRTPRRKNRIIAYTLGVHALFDLFGIGDPLVFAIIPMVFYTASLMLYLRRSMAFKKVFGIGAAVDGIYMFTGMMLHGIDAVSLSSVISMIAAMTLIFKGKIHISMFKVPDLSWKIVKIFLISLWCVIVILPIWNVIVMGLSKENVVPIKNPLPHGFTLSNFADLFQNYGLMSAIKNSLIISSFAVFISFITIFPATWAAAVSRKAVRLGNAIVFASFFVGMHTLIPLVMTFRFFNLANTLEGVSIASVSHSAVIAYFLLYPFLAHLPKNLDEAAKIDGASGLIRMICIYLPLALPSLAAVGVFVFIDAWNSFILPLVLLNSQRLYPVSMMLYNLIGQYGTSYSHWNIFGAGAILNVIIIGVVFYTVRKHIMSGVIAKGGTGD